METVSVHDTDLRLPRLALGAMTVGGQLDEERSRDLIEAALAAGVNHIDTANRYENGRSEEILGRILRGRRHEVLLSSKVGSPGAFGRPSLAPEVMRRELTASLQRLQTDYLDLYYLHRPDRATPLAESLGVLDEFVREGLVRYPAVSNYAAWHLAAMHGMAREHGWEPVRVSQPLYNLLARRIEDEYVEATMELGVANVVYNPLAGGLLTGKHHVDRNPSDGTRFSLERYSKRYRERYWYDEQFAAVELLQGIADEAGLTLVQLSFRWLLSQPHVHSVLLGVSTAEQLRSNIAACESGPLPSDVLEACDAVRSVVHGVAPTYVK